MSANQEGVTPRPTVDVGGGEVGGGSGGQSSVCRDYLRNVCKRGAHCRYWHPPPEVALDVDVVFCHDFQNAGCRRADCRFVHGSRENEEVYRRTGQLPTGVSTAGTRTGATTGSGGDVPVCKDFLKGECRRGLKCKFEHLHDGSSVELVGSSEFASTSSSSSVKIRKTEPADGEVELVTLADYRAVEEENRCLRHDVDELRRTVSVLVATNEMLLEQNAKYRSSSASQAANQMIATPAVIESSSAVAALSHIAIEGGSGLVVAQQTPTAASVAVATLRPCVTATATLHPVMTATPRLHPIATATLHPVGAAALHQNSAATLHSVVPASAVAVDPSPGSVAIGVPSHAIVPVTITVAAVPTTPVAPIAASSQLQSASTYVTYPIMSNGTHVA